MIFVQRSSRLLRLEVLSERCLQVLSRQREGTPMAAGQCEFTLVRDSEAALTTGQW